MTIKISGIYFYNLKNVKTIRSSLKKLGGNKYLFYLFYFNTIVWYFPKSAQIAFLKFNCHFLRMTQFQTPYFSEFIVIFF